MGTKTVMYSISTDKPYEAVKQATMQSLMALGGQVLDFGESIQVKQGINNINFAFTANFDAVVHIRKTAENRYDFIGNISWNPNAVFWVCLVLGFFLFGILWIINLLYAFIDPTDAYQKALFLIPNLLQ